MRDDKLKSQLFERRAVVLGGLKLVAVAALTGRLYHLQILESDEYKVMSEDNRIKILPILPARGKILDRFGKVLAENNNYFRIMLDDSIVKNPEDTLREIGKLLNFSEDRIQLLLKKLEEDYLRGATIVDHFLQWDEVAKIEEHQPELAGVSIDSLKLRHYPFAAQTSHLLGYIGPISKKDTSKNPMLSHPDFREGKNGIEKMEDLRLRGEGGAKRMEVNVHGLGVRELAFDKPVNGEDLHLTIDVELQTHLAKKLEDIGGVKKAGNSVVVIDILNGDVLAMVSSPGFDPNRFLLGISHDDWKELSSDPDVPLINKAISSQYPAGSTFKPVTAMAGLKAGVINAHTSVYCPGYMQFGSKTFHCWKEGGHGAMDVRSAITQSCNVFFYQISQRIGIQGIADMARTFGLGQKHDIELPQEKAGLIPDPAWKRKTLGQEWYAGETINTSIGQGYVLVTPMQLAVQSARVASGRKVVPRLMKQKNEADPINYKTEDLQKSPFEDLGLNPYYMDLVREGMKNVVNSTWGTAVRSAITEPGWEMAG